MIRVAPAALAALLVLASCGGEVREAEVERDAAEAGAASPPDVAPPEFVSIPGGEFEMGASSEEDCQPAHLVRVLPFELARHEVTNAQYRRFCEETGREPPLFWGLERFRSGPGFPDHPVCGVTWADAKAYCEWIGARLPTEAEWEFAARGGLEGENFPWGDELTPELANAWISDGPRPVGSYEPNAYGLYDMAGNIAEWTADWYDPGYYATSPLEDPRGPEEGKYRVVRGGGWHSGPYCNRVYRRLGLLPYFIDFNTGFRCARDVGPRPAEDAGA